MLRSETCWETLLEARAHGGTLVAHWWHRRAHGSFRTHTQPVPTVSAAPRSLPLRQISPHLPALQVRRARQPTQMPALPGLGSIALMLHWRERCLWKALALRFGQWVDW